MCRCSARGRVLRAATSATAAAACARGSGIDEAACEVRGGRAILMSRPMSRLVAFPSCTPSGALDPPLDPSQQADLAIGQPRQPRAHVPWARCGSRARPQRPDDLGPDTVCGVERDEVPPLWQCQPEIVHQTPAARACRLRGLGEHVRTDDDVRGCARLRQRPVLSRAQRPAHVRVDEAEGVVSARRAGGRRRVVTGSLEAGRLGDRMRSGLPSRLKVGDGEIEPCRRADEAADGRECRRLEARPPAKCDDPQRASASSTGQEQRSAQVRRGRRAVGLAPAVQIKQDQRRESGGAAAQVSAHVPWMRSRIGKGGRGDALVTRRRAECRA